MINSIPLGFKFPFAIHTAKNLHGFCLQICYLFISLNFFKLHYVISFQFFIWMISCITKVSGSSISKFGSVHSQSFYIPSCIWIICFFDCFFNNFCCFWIAWSLQISHSPNQLCIHSWFFVRYNSEIIVITFFTFAIWTIVGIIQFSTTLVVTYYRNTWFYSD